MKKKTLILIIIGIALYSFSLFNGFVWDDEVLRDSNASTVQSYFRPVMSLMRSILFTLFGSQPFFFHLFSVIFHIAIAVLLFYLFRRFFKEGIAFFLSLLFLVHPANVEAVCFASAMQEVTFTFTGILGLYLLVRSKNISITSIIVSIALFVAAILMKETAIVFFALAFCYLLIFHRKNTNTIQLYVAFAVIAVFTYMVARFSSGNFYVQGEGLFPIMRVTLATRLINIPSIIIYYLGTAIFPFNLGIAQQWVVRSISFSSFYFPLMLEITLFVGAIVYILKTKNKVFTFFFLWFLIGLLPHVQIIPLNMIVAERWLYFSQIGLLGMGGAIIQGLELKVQSPKLKYILILILVMFFIRSFIRTLDWRNGLALYSRDIRNDSSFDLQNNMGVELFRIGKYAEAKKYFEISTRLAPYWWVNWNNLGASYEQEKNFSKAQEYYQKSIQNGLYQIAYENLAKILVFHGSDKKKATEFIQKALRLFPEDETLKTLATGD